MEELTIEEIIAATNGKLLSGNINTKISNISIDSRTIKPNDLFIAIKGKNLDGHQFIPEALVNGAAGAIISDLNIKTTDSILIQVLNTTKALGSIAEYYRQKFNPLVIAVTGSNGKTTTKDIIASILSHRMKVIKAKESFNNDIGVPLTILEIDSKTQALVLEMEMNILGEIKRLAEIAKPKIGVVTNIGDTHLEFLGSRENVMKEKAELVESLGADGVAVLNADDELVMSIGNQYPNVSRLTFGINNLADVSATKIINLGFEGSHFLLAEKYRVRLPVPGRHNIYNALAAVATARATGLDYAAIIPGIEDFKPSSMRLEIIKLKDLLIINDAYNANPQSMAEALTTFTKIASEGRRIAVLGDMLELGEASQAFHTELGKEVVKTADILITVGNFSQAIIDGALSNGMNPDNLSACQGNQEALTKLIDILKPKDTILIKGSRAMHLEEIVQGIIAHYEKKTN
jgi:UDP-N-acetylmuramoyl-tripeptide--D-alanyl-D-alanine ligase